MTRKMLTPFALGFAAIMSVTACGGGDTAADGALTDTGAAAPPAPAPAPAATPSTDTAGATGAAADTMGGTGTGTGTGSTDTTRRDTTRTPPPSR